MYKGNSIIKRAAQDRLEKLAKHFPVVLLKGSRGAGKTTLLKSFSQDKDINYVTFEYPRNRVFAKSDPELFLQQYKAPLIIDESQYAPELLPYIKIYVDKTNTNGQHYLTGSQMFYAMKNVSESLAGRVGILILYSLSHSEIDNKESKPFLNESIIQCEQKRSITEVFEDIYRGGTPKLITDKELFVEDYFDFYMQTYLERDIKDFVNVKDETKFLRFIASTAARTAQELNISDIAKDVQIDTKTADNWLSILVSSGLVYLLQPYSGNNIKRIVKRPKLYFMDTG